MTKAADNTPNKPNILSQLRKMFVFDWALDGYRDIKKDFKFKRYKYYGKIWKDLNKPFVGIGNLLWGVIGTALALPAAVIAAIATPLLLYAVMMAFFEDLIKKEQISLGAAKTVSILLSGIVSIVAVPVAAITTVATLAVYGVGQMLLGVERIAMTPINWLVIVPLRALATLILGTPKIETGKFVQQKHAEADEWLKETRPQEWFHSLKASYSALHMRFKSRRSKGQDTDINLDDEEALYTQAKEDPVNQGEAYLKLFQLTNPAPKQDLSRDEPDSNDGQLSKV